MSSVVQDLSSVEFFSASIQPLHPVIYATAIVLLLCLLAIIGSYIYHHRQENLSTYMLLGTVYRCCCPTFPSLLW